MKLVQNIKIYTDNLFFYTCLFAYYLVYNDICKEAWNLQATNIDMIGPFKPSKLLHKITV